ncbi:unnamed protein product [Cyprideis torosa]|uniref:Uncharacterized protein n=1 Tax=Cyprideis torosa TaxID=163714 RepID=A0A7R8W904_9CRUS|nr:unnamed protein product [Cyprideis torosa]CAG0884363.1 unnamed protein product [Cyprideis torosa]
MVTLLLVLIVGLGLRVALISWDVKETLVDRPELATPLNSWKRIKEASYLSQLGYSPYEGDLYHGSPLTLFLGSWALNNFKDNLWLVFAVLDGLTALLIYYSSKIVIKDLIVSQEKEANTYHPTVGPRLKLQLPDLSHLPICAASFYLLNPYSLLSSAAHSSCVFSCFYLMAALYSALSQYPPTALLFLALASVEELYPVILLPAISLMLTGAHIKLNQGYAKRMAQHTIIFLAMLLGMNILMAEMAGDWRFLQSHYGFILTVPDPRPNIGLFWYFFMEMFDHFRSLFAFAFQLNAFIYTLPLMFKFFRRPFLVFTALLAIQAIFKSYPSAGDVGLYLSLLPLFSHLLPWLRQPLIEGTILVATSLAAPVLWHLWLFDGSANANFFFGITLGFAVAQTFLLTDLLFAQKSLDILGLDKHGRPLTKQMVKEAYLVMAKQTHPDAHASRKEDSDVSNKTKIEQFQRLQDAYKLALKNCDFTEGCRRRMTDQEIEEVLNETMITVQDSLTLLRKTPLPQHRQYLSYDGMGFGNPTEREKQVQSWRVQQAQDRILDYQIAASRKGDISEQDHELEEYRIRNKKNKQTGIDRLVEDLIQEAMSRGAFDNLKGAGKPLKRTTDINPYVDFTTHKMNELLIQEGFRPEWVLLEKEIKEETANIRTLIAKGSSDEELAEQVKILNTKVDRYNLHVPILSRQRVHFELTRERNRKTMEEKKTACRQRRQ